MIVVDQGFSAFAFGFFGGLFVAWAIMQLFLNQAMNQLKEANRKIARLCKDEVSW